jgi:hypothetical protein
MINVSRGNSDNQIKFIGPSIIERKKVGLLVDSDHQNYFLRGYKDLNTGLINHQLNLYIKYTSSDRRNYSSASSCDKWQGCSDGTQMDIELVSSVAANCDTSNCDYSEVIELNLSDDFLKSNMEGFSMRFNSILSTNKITIPSAYIKGYLRIVKQN